MASLDLLLNRLNIGGSTLGKDDNFSEELGATELSIFHPLSNLGYFSWDPKQDSCKALSSIQHKREISCYIDLNGKPDLLKPIQRIETPVRFRYLESTGFENKFPHGEIDIACLYVATKVSTAHSRLFHYSNSKIKFNFLTNWYENAPPARS